MNALFLRKNLQKTKRIVIKLGTNVIADETGHPDRRRLEPLMKGVAALQKKGKEIILVSSGAISAGMHEMQMKKRPTTLPDLQMASAIGQGRLIALYHAMFAKHHLKISQLLVTYDDLHSKKRCTNMQRTLHNLLKHRVIPIINENDAIADEEIRFGDNDVLSARIAKLVDADLLILLTTPNGLQKPSSVPGKTERISYLKSITKNILKLAVGKTNERSSGGMASKLLAAQTAVKSGAQVVIASGFHKNVLTDVVAGKDVGTLIGSP